MDRVRGRILLLLMVVAAALSALLTYSAIPTMLGRSLPSTLDLGVWMLLWYVLLFLFLLWPLRRIGLTFRQLMGTTPDRSTVGWAFLTAVGLVGVSVAAVYAVFVPLSLVAPDAVSSWLFEDPPVLYWRTGEHRWLANSILFAAGVVAAPLVEEFLFRGLLLPAWIARMGEKAAVILTSLCFGALHADILGGFIFAGIMAMAFLRTGRLWVPVLLHAFNNSIAWMITIGTAIAGMEESPASVEQLQATWWHGVIGLAIGLPLLVAMLRRLPKRVTAAPPGLSELQPGAGLVQDLG